VLLILASPHVLLEPSGAGARPVHPIRDHWDFTSAFGAKRKWTGRLSSLPRSKMTRSRHAAHCLAITLPLEQMTQSSGVSAHSGLLVKPRKTWFSPKAVNRRFGSEVAVPKGATR
jgi:hypothetical protein